jgi:hypothetical protein
VYWPAGQTGPFAYDITKFGGPSYPDWCSAIGDGVPSYILDKQYLYVADPTGLTCADSSQFKHHHKRYNGSCQIIWRELRGTAFNVG